MPITMLDTSEAAEPVARMSPLVMVKALAVPVTVPAEEIRRNC